MSELVITVGDYWLYNEKLVKIITASSETAEVEFVISGRVDVVEVWKLKAIPLTESIFIALGFTYDDENSAFLNSGRLQIQTYNDYWIWESRWCIFILNHLVWIARLTATKLNFENLKYIFNEN